MGHKIRIAQLGVTGEDIASSLDEVDLGLGCHWVEIDGHRFDAVVSATFGAIESGPVGDEVTIPTITLQIIGPVEIVYLGVDNEPLEGVDPYAAHRAVRQGDRFDADTNRP